MSLEALQPTEVYMDGATYAIVPMPAMKAALLLPRLAPVVGVVITQFKNIAVAMEGGSDGMEQGLAVIGDTLSALAAKLSEHDLEVIINGLLWNVTRDKKSVSPGTSGFNDAFTRKLTLVFRLMAHAFQINYSDFYEAVRDAIQAAVARLRPEQNKSPTAASITSPTPGPATA